jgi:hypothetical protein
VGDISPHLGKLSSRFLLFFLYSLKCYKLQPLRKSKKDRSHNDKKKKDKRTNNDPQNTTQKTKDRATRTPLKKRGTNTANKS